MLKRSGNWMGIESDRLAVKLASVIHSDHIDDAGLIINTVANAPVPNTNPPKFFTFYFQATVRAWVSASARMAETTRIFTALSRRLSSRSAREVITTLYIDLPGSLHLFYDFIERTARFVLTFVGDADQV